MKSTEIYNSLGEVIARLPACHGAPAVKALTRLLRFATALSGDSRSLAVALVTRARSRAPTQETHMRRQYLKHLLAVTPHAKQWRLEIVISAGPHLSISYTLSIFLDRKTALACRDRLLEELSAPF